jgi:hypothetical protein
VRVDKRLDALIDRALIAHTGETNAARCEHFASALGVTFSLQETERPRFRAFSDGRCWARTSDPQLVECGQVFAPVCTRSVIPPGYRGCATAHRTRPNGNERQA